MGQPVVIGSTTKVSLAASEWWKAFTGLCTVVVLIVSFFINLKFDVKAAAAQASEASAKAESNAKEVTAMKEDLNSTFKELIAQVSELKGYVAGMADNRPKESNGK